MRKMQLASRPCLRYAKFSVALLSLSSLSGFAFGAEPDSEPAIQEVVIEGSRNSQIGVANSSSAGVITQKQLEARTVYRPGELLEATPGLIVSQHSGEGKANQFTCVGSILITERIYEPLSTVCLLISALTPMDRDGLMSTL